MNAGALDRTALAGLSARLLLVLPPLLWLAHTYAWEWAQLWLPWYRWLLDHFLTGYEVVSLALVHRQGEWLILGEFVSTRLHLVHGEILPRGVGIEASTLMAHTLKAPLILATAALVWPGLTWRGRLARLLLALPILLLLMSLDVPLVLMSAVHDLVSWSASARHDAAALTVDWTRVMDGGGRLALALAGTLAMATLHAALDRALARMWTRLGR